MRRRWPAERVQRLFGFAEVFLLVILLAGCQDGVALSIDVRTDFVPNAEFVAVSTTVVGERDPITRAAEGNFLLGWRAVDLEGLAPSRERRIVVQLIDANGASLAERTVLIDHQVDRSLTVSLSRDCRDTACPGAGPAAATTCFGGRCVDPACVDGSEPSCPEPECTGEMDCPSLAACSVARCLDGVCLYEARSDACDAGSYCSPEEGCLPLPMSTDGGSDAGMDAGVLQAPRPTWPLNGATTGTVMPRLRLHWTAVPGASDYQVQWSGACEADQRVACPFDMASTSEMRTIETSLITPALPVSNVAPVGRRYRWRVRACAGDECGEWSAVRYVDYGRGGSDFDGDGLDDLVVGSAEHATHFEFDGAEFAVQRELDSPFADASASFGLDSHYADFNGDGFVDVVFSAESNQGFGSVAVFLGSAAGLSAPSTIDRPASSPLNGFFSRTICAADFDADGFADLAVSSVSTSFIYHGSPSGLSPTLVVERDGSYPSCADLDEDGFADLILSDRYFPGNATGVAATSRALPGRVGYLIGDVNGDGLGDFTGDGIAATTIAYGTLGSVSAPVPVGGVVGGVNSFDFQAIGSTDLNGDGFSDAFLGDSQSDSRFPGVVAWAQGGAAGLGDRTALTVNCEAMCSRRGYALGYGFDLNGDGFGDGATSAVGEEAAFVFFGGASGVSTPHVRIPRSDARFDGFGSSL